MYKYLILYFLYEYFVLKILYFYCDINKIPLQYLVEFFEPLNRVYDKRNMFNFIIIVISTWREFFLRVYPENMIIVYFEEF